jgi:hypothetical protein
MKWNLIDISQEAFGKYQYGTWHAGMWYADEDFMFGNGSGPLKWGAVPAPGQVHSKPWRGYLVNWLRKTCR